MKKWKSKALELMLSTDTSWRQIAKIVGKPRSTVSDYLRKFKKEPNLLHEVIQSQFAPKVLLFDIETSTILAHIWRTGNQTVTLPQIEDDWYIICFSAKWFRSGDVFNSSVHQFEEPLSGQYKDNERYVVEALWKLLDDADIVVAYNGKSFDKKKVNWKFFEYGLPEPSPYTIVDPYLIIRGNFAPTSGKMDYIAKYVDRLENGKNSTNIELWKACRRNDLQSLDYMLSYCDQDIVVLEEVYDAVKHWDKNSPQLSLYFKDDKMRCTCGSEDLVELEGKFALTGVSKFPVYRCNTCTKILRSRASTTNKDKRKNVLANVR